MVSYPKWIRVIFKILLAVQYHPFCSTFMRNSGKTNAKNRLKESVKNINLELCWSSNFGFLKRTQTNLRFLNYICIDIMLNSYLHSGTEKLTEHTSQRKQYITYSAETWLRYNRSSNCKPLLTLQNLRVFRQCRFPCVFNDFSRLFKVSDKFIYPQFCNISSSVCL